MNKPVIVVCIVFGAFMAGRYTAPDHVIKVEKINTVTVEKLHTDDKSKTATRIVVKESPDGTKVTQTDTVTLNDIVSYQDKAITVSAEKSTVSENRRKWLLQGFLNIRASGAPGVGFGASYRVLGPFSAGVAWMPERPVNIILGVEL
jgi:threonine dehydratase